MKENNTDLEKDEYWVSISDLMSGLMMLFLFISISYMLQAQFQAYRERENREIAEEQRKEAEQSRETMHLIAENYSRLRDDLYYALFDEFENDLSVWSAIIERETLSIRFQEPEVLFGQGSSDIQDVFQYILNDFFPRYIQVLRRPEFAEDIEEIRIEGHTSSEWTSLVDEMSAYFFNMELSQDRTRSVLEYVIMLDDIKEHREWIRDRLTANGLSSSKLIYDQFGNEDKELSRRVEFRVRTNAESRLEDILSEGGL